jgi:hypothetical protein
VSSQASRETTFPPPASRLAHRRLPWHPVNQVPIAPKFPFAASIPPMPPCQFLPILTNSCDSPAGLSVAPQARPAQAYQYCRPERRPTGEIDIATRTRTVTTPSTRRALPHITAAACTEAYLTSRAEVPPPAPGARRHVHLSAPGLGPARPRIFWVPLGSRSDSSRSRASNGRPPARPPFLAIRALRSLPEKTDTPAFLRPNGVSNSRAPTSGRCQCRRLRLGHPRACPLARHPPFPRPALF